MKVALIRVPAPEQIREAQRREWDRLLLRGRKQRASERASKGKKR